jgi:hypothetical protein
MYLPEVQQILKARPRKSPPEKPVTEMLAEQHFVRAL